MVRVERRKLTLYPAITANALSGTFGRSIGYDRSVLRAPQPSAALLVAGGDARRLGRIDEVTDAGERWQRLPSAAGPPPAQQRHACDLPTGRRRLVTSASPSDRRRRRRSVLYSAARCTARRQCPRGGSDYANVKPRQAHRPVPAATTAFPRRSDLRRRSFLPLDIAKLAQALLEARKLVRIGGCSAGPYPAHARRILRLRLMRCRQRNEALARRRCVRPHSITSSARSKS